MSSWVTSGAVDGAALARAAATRLAARLADGSTSGAELERVAVAELRTFAGDEVTSEAFRRCCIAYAVARPAPITSHRPIVGPLLVAAKRVLRRLLRFQTETFLARQEEFNRNLLVVLRDLVEHGRRERPPER